MWAARSGTMAAVLLDPLPLALLRCAGSPYSCSDGRHMDYPDWTREYFERGYAQRWGLPAPSDDVRLQADGLWSLRLSPGSRVIDTGCGHGRHAHALAERGAEVFGLDASVALLNRARHLAAELRTQVHWIRGDMRWLPFRSKCASAAIMMDVFGFFDTEEEHEAACRRPPGFWRPAHAWC